MTIRIGQGYDLHKLVDGRPLILGGVHIPFEKGLYGHSDADVLLHAITDALLGSLALGDIGTHFPDTDERWKGADSGQMLTHCLKLIHDRGWRVGNVDAVVIAEAPRLAPYVTEMRLSVAELLDLDFDDVSVKATTNEGLGAIGDGRAIAVQAVIVVYKD